MEHEIEIPREIIASGWMPQDGYIQIDSDWILFQFVDYEDDDVRKLGHYLWHVPSGEIHYMDWDPYERVTVQQAKRWLALGCPKRIGIGPLNEKALQELEARQK